MKVRAMEHTKNCSNDNSVHTVHISSAKFSLTLSTAESARNEGKNNIKIFKQRFHLRLNSDVMTIDKIIIAALQMLKIFSSYCEKGFVITFELEIVDAFLHENVLLGQKRTHFL